MIIDINSPISYNVYMILIGIGKVNERDAIYTKAIRVYNYLTKSTHKGEIAHEESGKPYVKGAVGLEISLSHSGEQLVIALSSERVGVDIQEMKEVDYKKICTRYDIDATDLTDFYKKFTLAECRAKVLGTGLPQSLRQADGIIGKTYTFIKGYVLSVIGSGEVIILPL